MIHKARISSSSLSQSSGGGGDTESSPGSFSRWEDLFDEAAPVEDHAEKAETHRDALLLLVDCSLHMFTEDAELVEEDGEEGVTPFKMAIRACVACIKTKIVSSENDLVGVIFYCTERSKNGTNFPGVYAFQKLDMPDAEKIKALEELAELSAEEFPLGHAEPHNAAQFQFSHALWTCSTLFQGCSMKTNTHRVFIFTSEDQPCGSDRDLSTQAIQRVHDMHDVGIQLELFAFDGSGKTFDVNKFFRHVVQDEGEDSQGPVAVSAVQKMDEMLAQIRKKNFAKRTTATVPMSVAPGLDCWVNVYTAFREADRPKHMWLDPVSNEPVKPETTYSCADTLMALRPDQQLRCFEFGSADVLFEPDEVKKMRHLYPVGVCVLGFKPRYKLKVDHNVQHSSFLFPSEAAAKGSTTVFISLLDSMLARDVFAVARWVPRAASAPRLVALLPHREEHRDGMQVSPSGFYVVALPFADEIRPTVVPENERADMEAVVLAEQMIQQMCVRYDPGSFLNPRLQRHFSVLESLALDRNRMEDDEDDMLVVDEEGLEPIAAYIDAFREAVIPEGYSAVAVKSTKRARAFEGDWADLVRSDANMGKVTVAMIDAKLTELTGSKGRGKKADKWAQLKDAMPSQKKKAKVEIKEEEEEEEAS